jgi:ankyrin repeat protein
MRRVLLLVAAIATPALAAEVDFERDVKPILRENCWGCHGPTQQAAMLRLDQREAALIAGRGKMAIVPGGSDRSLVYRRIAGLEGSRMPPTGPLTPEQIATIKDWLDQGAKWPDEPAAQRDWTPEPRLAPLLGEIRKGNFAAVHKAVATDAKLARARDDRGFTLLMQASLYAMPADVSWLLARGADPKAADVGGITALMLAVDDSRKVRALLKAGADPNAHSIDGRTALLLAADRKQGADVLRVLLENGAKSAPEPGQVDPLVQVTRNGDTESMKLLAAQRDGKYPPAAVTAAAQADCMACLRMVLDQGPPKAAISDALRVASVTSDIDILKALLAAGADPNAKDATGQTALMRAAYSDLADPERVRLLLDHGADVNAQANNGDTALKKAERKGPTDVAKLLGIPNSEDSPVQMAKPVDVHTALLRSLPLLQKTGPSFFAGSGCISCHHQSLPAMAVSIAREHGFPVDETAEKAVVKLVADYLDARRERLLEGISPPGVQDTTSYILFGLAVEHFPGSEAVEAAARYLKVRQSQDGSWQVAVHRPPLESSTITVTALVMRDLAAFAPAPLRAEYNASIAKAAVYLAQAQPLSNEDYAYKILGLVWTKGVWSKGPKAAIAQTAAALARRQRADGGWSQLPTLESDAYATGQALVALEASGMKTTNPVYKNGVDFLLRTQLADGSWHVKSRAEPVQVYFESGFPHGIDQFISTAGTSWATAALALTSQK